MKNLLFCLSLLLLPFPVWAGQSVTGNLTVTGNTGLGTTTPGSSLTILKNGSADYMHINSTAAAGGNLFKVSNGGNIGINSTAPGVTLDIQGTLRVSNTITGSNLSGTNTGDQTNIVGNAGTATALAANGSNCTAGNYPLGVDASGAVENCTAVTSSQWATQNTTDVSLAGGNVGVGTTKTTTAALTVMNGNVGIGTWIPTVSLFVKGDTTGTFVGQNTSTPAAGSGAGIIGQSSTIPTASGQRLGFYLLGALDAGVNRNSAGIQGFSDQAWSSGSATGTYLTFETTANNSTSRSERMRIDNGGNVGINTTLQASKLSIGGNTSIGTAYSTIAAPTNGMIVQGNTGFATSAPINVLDVNGGMVGGTYAGVNTAPSNGYVVSGNVGVGTFVPSQQFEVGARKFDITSAGNVGIGSVSPSQALDVNGGIRSATSGTSYFNGILGIGTTVPVANLTIVGNVGIGTVSGDIYTQTAPPNGGAIIYGNVGISTINPSGKLNIAGTTGIGWTVKSGANTACNTTCPATSACVFGEDTSVIGTIVACTDATADICICAGP